MKRGDLVRFRDDKRTVQAIAVRIASDPDRLSVFLFRSKRGHAEVRRMPAFVPTVEGAVIAGKQHLDHEQAALRAELAALASSEYGKQKIIEATRRAPLSEPAQQYKTSRRGRLADSDVPVDNRSLTTQVIEGERSHPPDLDRYLAVHDPGAQSIGPEAREIRYLDELRRRNDRYYRVYLAMVIDRRSYADLAALLGTSESAARQVVSRARRAYEAIARATQMAVNA